MKFSIIVPVYNVEKYLVECLNSLINQNFNKYEIILVDDGSTDLSGKICDDYSREYNKIKVIHQKNSGLSMARNAGIKLAKGEYILFIDSDDYICDEEFLKKANNILEKEKSDLLIFGHKKYFEVTGKFQEKKSFKIEENKKIIELLIQQNYLKASACDKIIKLDILNKYQLLFPNGRLSEDILWCTDVLEHINTDAISVLDANEYVYRQRATSISKNVGVKHINDIYELIFEKYNSSENKYVREFLAYEYSVLLGWVGIILKGKENQKLKNKIFGLDEILKYDLSNKVKAVNKLIKICGISTTSKILGLYIKLK